MLSLLYVLREYVVYSKKHSQIVAKFSRKLGITCGSY